MRTLTRTIPILLLVLTEQTFAQTEKMNFRARQAVIINNAAQQIELSGFKFENEFRQSQFRLVTNLSWKNISSKPITAFEVVILRYDPFNRPIPGGGTWMITGNNSGNWAPLMPGQSSSDGLLGYGAENVMTSIVYVRAVRFEDGGVWTADISAVEKDIRQKLPVLRDLGTVSPPLGEQKKQ
jgi:hypothetical protein